MFKKIIFISILLILSIGIASASEDIADDVGISDSSADIVQDVADETGTLQDLPSGDLTPEVDDIEDVGLTQSQKNFTYINNKISSSTKNTLTLSGTYTAEDALNSIIIDKNFTLQGKSGKMVIFDGSKLNVCPIISSYGDNIEITLKNIIFKNCNSYAINANNNLIIENCKFENNYQAVYVYAPQDSTISIINSNFTCNGDDGALNLYMNSQSSAKITNCVFNNNKAAEYGGAIYIRGAENFAVDILSSTFNSNSAKEYSAIWVDGGSGNIKNNIFIGNSGKDDIGSVGSISASYILENNAVKPNSAVNENLKIEFLNNPTFYGDICQIRFTKDGKPLANKRIIVNAEKNNSLTNYAVFNVLTDSRGIAKFAFSSNNIYDVAGFWNFQILADSGSTKLLVSNNNLNINKLTGKVILNPLSTTYASGKVYTFKLVNKLNNKAAANLNLYVTLYKNGYYFKNYVLKTDLNGVTNLKISNFVSANYKIEVTSHEPSSILSLAKTSANIKINKAPTKVKAPVMKVKAKKAKKYKFKVFVKAYNKPVNNLKVVVKVFTGKKAKTFKLKTNKKGVAEYKLSKMKLKKGKHKVLISSGNGNYKISAKSKIIIK